MLSLDERVQVPTKAALTLTLEELDLDAAASQVCLPAILSALSFLRILRARVAPACARECVYSGKP